MDTIHTCAYKSQPQSQHTHTHTVRRFNRLLFFFSFSPQAHMYLYAANFFLSLSRRSLTLTLVNCFPPLCISFLLTCLIFFFIFIYTRHYTSDRKRGERFSFAYRRVLFLSKMFISVLLNKNKQ